ncbi:MAG TPA: hypothetical protein VHN79_00735 [Lacunisphaera sp.]|nr:hypothetical protein [Lacunisphaera sp.]
MAPDPGATVGRGMSKNIVGYGIKQAVFGNQAWIADGSKPF